MSPNHLSPFPVAVSPGLPVRGDRPLSADALRRSVDDPALFGVFYAEHSERLLVFLTRRVLDVEVALDLMSETFAVALERRRSFRGVSREEEIGWLYAIARTQLSRYWRSGAIERRALKRLGLEGAQLSDPEVERVERLAGISDLATRVNGALSGLPPAQQEATRLRVIDELDYAAVAERVGISEQTARARVSRGLRALLVEMDENESTGDMS